MSRVRDATLAALLVLAPPAWAQGAGGPGFGRDSVDVQAALAHYDSLVQAMDHDGIAALFAPDGELVSPGQAPIVGPEAIRRFLRSFQGFHVIANALVADTTVVRGPTSHQSGHYSQRVAIPSGDTVAVQGRFLIEWQRDSAGAWRIRRLATVPGT